ncbi:AraC family transcriptional regulator [Chryseobacterium sp. GP-SGM7]|uniref:AraC family transcriptional regulator n=1 Tax=Chryseobacterium sp. GP-SGM7 TaxID=3411323 RepID=UPI003B9609FA
MLLRKCFLVFLLLFLFNYGKSNSRETYEELKKSYEKFDENDKKALRFVSLYLKKAKQEKNYFELKQGYEDFSYYSPDKTTKLKYSDSAIVSAKMSANNDLISSAYLYKGSLYHFYGKNYQSALDLYLKAYQHSKNTKDEYLKYKVLYQMGLVKNYLGYYEEAAEHFKECAQYFEPKTRGNYHPNIIYNSTKGYLNSLHQLSLYYHQSKDYKSVDSINLIGLNLSSQSKDYVLEKAYFLKSKGILEYNTRNYKKAVENLSSAIAILKNNDDFYWSSVTSYYIGKSYLESGKENAAINHFTKVDSIFQKKNFIVPELLENYNFLINYYQNKKDYTKELEYSKKLLKADSILNKDFKYLSSKIHKDYDKKVLEEAKIKLESKNNWKIAAIIFLLCALMILTLITRNYYKKGKIINLKYHDLEKRLLLQTKPVSLSYESISTVGKSVMNENVFLDLQKNLQKFENNNEFTEKGLTLSLLAEKLNTNTSYLSQFINETKEMNFNRYLSSLRINHITKQMYKNPKFLLLKVQGLADECGIGSRQNFSDLFQEINGIRPTDFIKQRKKELEETASQNVIISSS